MKLCPPALWEELALGDPTATFFQTPAWLRLAARHPGPERGATRPPEIAPLLFELPGGPACLPLLRDRRWGRDRYFSAFGVYAALLAPRVLAADEIARVEGALSRLNLHLVSSPFTRNAVHAGRRIPARVQSLDLGTVDPADVSRDWEKGQRRWARVAQREGLSVRVASADADWDAYYRLYELSLARWGDKATRAYPASVFRDIRELPESARTLWLAEKEGVIGAGVLAFRHGRHMAVWHSAADAAFFRRGARRIRRARLPRKRGPAGRGSLQDALRHARPDLRFEPQPHGSRGRAGVAARAAGPEAVISPGEQDCLAAYRAHIARAYARDFGVFDAALIDFVADAWFHGDARHDHRFAEVRERLPRAGRLLDLASGFGTAALRGLALGLDVFGLEPDAGKLELLGRRIDAGGLPRAWKARFARAVGETLPYKDGAFDCVLSYQTLEHVRDPEAVIAEMLRVTRAGGALHIRCPDYRSTYEGHYRLPWLPLLPKPLARAYLRARGRPTAGLEELNYVTGPRLARLLKRQAARAGLAVTVTDLEKERYRARLRGKGLPGWRGPALPWRALFHLRRAFREEIAVNLWVEVRRETGPRD
jgi:SAM-dependent methyltransferase